MDNDDHDGRIEMKKFLIVVMLSIVLAGCASVGHEIDQNAAGKIQKGVTTKQEVFALIGSPDHVMNYGNGDYCWTYSYVHATAKASSFIPVFGAFAGGANVQSQSLTLVFGPDNIVKNIVSSHSATEADTGVTTGPKPDVQDVEQNKRR